MCEELVAHFCSLLPKVNTSRSGSGFHASSPGCVTAPITRAVWESLNSLIPAAPGVPDPGQHPAVLTFLLGVPPKLFLLYFQNIITLCWHHPCSTFPTLPSHPAQKRGREKSTKQKSTGEIPGMLLSGLSHFYSQVTEYSELEVMS